MTIVGALVALAAVIVLFTDTDRLPLLLAAVVPFAATSAVSIAGQSVIPYHVVAVLLFALSLRTLATAARYELTVLPGARLLLGFSAWAVTVTVASPYIFAGISVLDPRRGIDTGVKDPSVLAPSISNFAQSGYLLLAVLTVVAIAFHAKQAYALPAVAFGAGTVLTTLKTLLPESVQTELFDNSGNVAYTAGKVDGVERLRGLFSEPSSLGAFSVAAFIFFIVFAARHSGPVRYLAVAFAIWSFTNAALSYSGGAVVTAIIVGLLIVARGAQVVVAGRTRISNVGVASGFFVLPVAVLVWPTVSTFASSIIVDKAGSSSAANRSAADRFSLDVLWNTAGIGSGLGSNRPSSFIMAVLSTVGIVGFTCLVGALAIILIYAFRDERYQAAVWSTVALLVSKSVSGPDISEPTLWFLLAVCAQGAWQVHARARVDTRSMQTQLSNRKLEVPSYERPAAIAEHIDLDDR